MLWIFLCLIAAISWTFSVFIDNYLTDVIFARKSPIAAKGLNGPLNILIAIIVGIVFQLRLPEPNVSAMLLLSGVISAIGVVPYFYALKREESTTAAIFFQLQPILFLIADLIIFGEGIGGKQLIGLCVILMAPIVIIFSRHHKKARRLEIIASSLFMLYTVCAVFSSEISAHANSGDNYIAVFVLYLFGRGITDCAFMLSPKLRKQHHSVMKNKKKPYLIFTFINQTICALADFVYRYALIIGTTALVSAITNASELIITFIAGIILSVIWPNFGREKLHRHVIFAHAIAVILCVIGIIIIQ